MIKSCDKNLTRKKRTDNTALLRRFGAYGQPLQIFEQR